MTPREAFKFGFLKRCAEEGLSGEETRVRIKQADSALEDIGTGVKHLGALGILGGMAAGGAGGYMMARATEPEVDTQDAQREELIATYKLYADQARRKALQRQYRTPAPVVAAPRLGLSHG